MAGAVFLTSTKQILRRADKATIEEIASMLDKELDPGDGDNLKAAGVDGRWFLKLSENEKKEFYPGWEGMRKRSVLTELIQYAQISYEASSPTHEPPLPTMNPNTPSRRRSAGPPIKPQTPTSTVGSPSSKMVYQQQPNNLNIPVDGQNPLLLAAGQQAQHAAAEYLGLQEQQAVAPQRVSNIENFTTEAVQFSLYTDPELESHRMLVPLPEKDRNRLSRQTISSMRTRTLRLQHAREPERSELMQMAQALCMRYPGLRDQDKPHPSENWEAFFKQLLRRQANVVPVKRHQGPTPQRSRASRTSLDDEDEESSTPPKQKKKSNKTGSNEACSSKDGKDDDSEDGGLSGVARFSPLVGNDEDSDKQDNGSEVGASKDKDKDEATSSEKQMLETYNQLMAEWDKRNPSDKKMRFYLLSEKTARRAYIDVLTSKVPEKCEHILERYPMFRMIEMCEYEMSLLLALDDARLEELYAEAAEELESMFAYGEKNNKITTSANGKSKAKFSLVMTNIVKIFPGKAKERKKDAILIICKDNEDYKKHAKSSIYPRMILSGKQVVFAVGGKELDATVTPKNMLGWGKIVVQYMSLYYTFNLEYPQGYDVALSMMQISTVDTQMHKDDVTEIFTKAKKKYDEFCK